MIGVGSLLSDTVRTLLLTHPLLVIATLIGIEELGIPSPLPGDLMMLYAGLLVAQHRESLRVVLLIQELATVTGASGLFFISHRLGRPFILRDGHVIHLTPERLAKVEETMRRHGAWAVLAGRLIPGLRIVTPIAAGVLDVPFLTFLPALALGGFLSLLALTLLGLLVGPTALDIFERFSQPFSAVGSFLALGILLFLVRKALPTLGRGRGLLFGGIAGFAALLATDGVLGLLRFGLRILGKTEVLSSAGVGSGWHLFLAWPLFLVVASLVGGIVHTFTPSQVPAAMRVALVALPAWLMTALVLYPLLEGRALRLTAQEEVIVLVEGVRWLVFGCVLNFLLPPIPTQDTPTATKGRTRAIPHRPPSREPR